MILGAHESTSGGAHMAFERGVAHGAECLQIFTRNQQQWQAAPVTRSEGSLFRAASERSEIPLTRVMVHDSYLINLASPDREKLRKSRRAMLSELQRCQRLGIELLNLHPGSHMGKGEQQGLARVIDSLDHLTEKTAESPVRFVLETTAGQGSSLGYRFEHIRTIFDGVAAPSRLAVCLDTAHSFAAGYDLSSEAGYESVMTEFDEVIGLKHLVAFHLNDSKAALGSRVDRHEDIGRGRLGETVFRCLMRDPRHERTMGIVELPEKRIAENLERLRRLRTRGKPRKRLRRG